MAKWLVRAFLAAAGDALTGRDVLDLAFKRARGPKFAVIGVGSASGPMAARTAVDAAYASAQASLVDAKSARAIAVFLISGPRADKDVRQQCLDRIKEHVRPDAAFSLHETASPTLKNRVRVVIVARGFLASSFATMPSALDEALRDRGWGYTHLVEGEGLDLEIWQGSVEFGVIEDLDRRLTNKTEIAAIAAAVPMYRGPVVLVLRHFPDIKIRNQLLLHGIIAVSIDRLDLLNDLVREPLRRIVSRLLRARPEDILNAMAVFVRDHMMRLFWRQEADVVIWNASHNQDEPFRSPGWLTETEPPEGQLEPFRLDARGPGRLLLFSGVLRINPFQGKAGHPMMFAFKVVIDDQGLRLREPLRFGSEVSDDEKQRNLNL